MRYVCLFPDCNKKFTLDRNRAAHARAIHNSKRHTCGICGASYVWKRNLVKHEKLHSTKDILKCDICGKTCKTTNGLGVHKKFTHHPILFAKRKKKKQKKDGIHVVKLNYFVGSGKMFSLTSEESRKWIFKMFWVNLEQR